MILEDEMILEYPRLAGTPEDEKALAEACKAYIKKFGYRYPFSITCGVRPEDVGKLAKEIRKRIKTNNPLPDPTEEEKDIRY